jgi:hypothetical protein
VNVVVLCLLAVVVAAAAVSATLVLDGDGGESASETEGEGTEVGATGTATRAAEGHETGPPADAEALERALEEARSGETIRLDGGHYEAVSLERKEFSEPVRIVGTAKTTVGELTVSKSRNVAFEGFVVTPAAGEEAVVSIRDSSDISFSRVAFDGRSESEGVSVKIKDDSERVRIVGSDFTKCRNTCVQPGGKAIEIQGSSFHDLIESDAVKGGGAEITIVDNSFVRAVPGEAHEHHNDFIQIMGGGPWLIARNHFGPRRFGAAQVFVNAGRRNDDNPIEGVTIASNLFTGDMAFAIHIGGETAQVSVVNNTILSGHKSAIRLSDSLTLRPEAERPLVANNVVAVGSERLCEGARTEANVFLEGTPCSESDQLGDLAFDATGQPTSSGELLVDAGDPAYAPETDLRGRSRNGSPDIGALELE